MDFSINDGFLGDNKTFCGLKVMASTNVKPVPVLQISPAFKDCTDDFREEMNQWLLNIFGTKNVAYVFNDTLFLNHQTLIELKRAMTANN